MTQMSDKITSIRGLAPWMGLSFVVIVIDYLTKAYFESGFFLGEVRRVTGFFNLVLAHNSGAAFSFLANEDGWQRLLFIAIAFVACAVCLGMMAKHPKNKCLCLALSMVIAGSIGNLIDRIMYGYVIDFLDFHWAGWHWPAFNVADMAIVAGAALMVLESFKKEDN